MIWLSASFVAVPAFSRVEPARTSGPTRSATTMSARRRSAGEGFAVTRIVRAPRRRPRASAPCTNGVTALAETPTTRSPNPARAARRSPSARASSAPSRARKTAPRPPAMNARTRAGLRAEGRWQLRRLENAEPAARSGSEDQAVAAGEVDLAEGLRGPRDLRASPGRAPGARAGLRPACAPRSAPRPAGRGAPSPRGPPRSGVAARRTSGRRRGGFSRRPIPRAGCAPPRTRGTCRRRARSR